MDADVAGAMPVFQAGLVGRADPEPGLAIGPADGVLVLIQHLEAEEFEQGAVERLRLAVVADPDRQVIDTHDTDHDSLLACSDRHSGGSEVAPLAPFRRRSNLRYPTRISPATPLIDSRAPRSKDMSTLNRIRKIALAATVATLASTALSASASPAKPAIADLGSMVVTAHRVLGIVDLGTMTVVAPREERVADLGSLTVTAPRIVTVAAMQPARHLIG